MYLLEPIRHGKWIYDPGLVMALQAYVRDHLFLDRDIIFPYMTEPSIQIGRYQNAYEEVNQSYIDQHEMQVVRRETGGGAIYLDDRNMSFCFLLEGNQEMYGNYAELYKPVIHALNALGVQNVEQVGRNDLVIEEQKVAGAAMTVEKNRVYAGYSLLLDPDYDAMYYSLTPDNKKIESHGIQSVRSRVGAIRPHLAPKYQQITVWEFYELIACHLLDIPSLSEADRYHLTAEDWEKVDQIARERFSNWEWNYGRFQSFTYHVSKRFSFGTVNIGLKVNQAVIDQLQITGDFFGVKPITTIEEALTGVQLKREALLEAIQPFHLADYIGEFTHDEFVDFLLSG